MFTGIISEVGEVKKIQPVRGGQEVHIKASFAGQTRVDESISVNGVCLTVVDKSNSDFLVQCVEETLRKSTLGSLNAGDPVNLERALTLEKAIDGHIVQGHVDTTGVIESMKMDGSDRLLTISCPERFDSYIVGRGSITVDGISLTVADESDSRFTVAIIPYTWENTNLESRKAGDAVNLEFDVFGKYIVKYLEKRFRGKDRV
ncbi:MAG: riboflavin synthase [Balneolaceae bacterium]